MAQCEVCGTDMAQGRGRARRTCSAACRQAAHRRRQAAQLAALRAATARTAPTAAAPVAEPVALPVADDSPAGQIRAAGAQLLAAIEAAAWRAAQDWDTDTSGALPGHRRTMPADAVAAVRALAEQTVAAILTSAPEPSRDEPAPATPVAAAPAPPARPEPSRPAAPEPSRNEPRRKTAPARTRMSRKAALAVADSAQLVKDPDHRDNHLWHLVAEDGTVLGHVEPSYGGTSRSGRNGWKYRTAESAVGRGPHPTRDAAGVQCALAWVRGVTAPARRD